MYNLPPGCDGKSAGNRLRRLSDNCGGKVLGVSMATGTAVLRFGSQEAAERARKRMENEDVFGRRITLSFSAPPTEEGNDPTPPPSSSETPPPLPVQPLPSSSFSFLPLEKPRSPRRKRRARRECQRERESSLPLSVPVPERPYSPRRGSGGALYPVPPQTRTLPQVSSILPPPPHPACRLSSPNPVHVLHSACANLWLLNYSHASSHASCSLMPGLFLCFVQHFM